MFTGLVREIGTLRGVEARSGATRLRIAAPRTAPDLGLGDSLAVNGVCLTVTALAGEFVTVEAAAETRRVTTLASWRIGGRLHLEPALRADDALGGHLMLGHVDGTGVLLARRPAGRSQFLTFGLPLRLMRWLLPKGSIAVDGVSLTVDEGPFRDRFTVNVIPHSLQSTLLGGLRVGQPVNLEMDVLVKAARGEVPPGALSLAGGARAGQRAEGEPVKPVLTEKRLLEKGWGRRPR